MKKRGKIELVDKGEKNGGVKDSRTYNEDIELRGYVMDLQNFDRVIKKAVKDKLITITETEITGVDDITFDL